MAIQKERTLDNGITVNYHRVVSINKITNTQNIIEVASYVDAEKREEEKQKIANGEEMDIFVHTENIVAPYDENANIKNVYADLMELDKFKDGIEV